MKRQLFFPILLFSITIVFFSGFFLQGRLPIPADTIIGLYHPFRDLYARDYPNGIPYKNFLVTDPVRQQYPWRIIASEGLKHLEIPLWNPYSFAGTPLLGNMQTAAFYPLNILLFILPFSLAWSLQVFLQPLLFALFMYLYLRNIGLIRYAAFLSSLTIAFCGFSVAWLEWNTVLHTVLWLPLLLLVTDKLFYREKEKTKSFFTDTKLVWGVLFIFSFCASFFAGHLQSFFYVSLITLLYICLRFIRKQGSWRLSIGFVVCLCFFILITSIQWYPAFQLISLSARDIDLNWQVEGWFLPWQHLLQLIIPDFFGNPTTLNYWGVWNYAEFSSYIGVLPLLFSLYAIFFRRDKKTYVFSALVFLSLLCMLPTGISALPFLWKIPLLSTAQPTRLLFITDFSLAVLAGLGCDYFLKMRKRILYPILLLFILYFGVWFTVTFLASSLFHISPEHIATAKRNLYLPIALFVFISIVLLGFSRFTSARYHRVLISILLLITIFDLFRFFTKFTPFTESSYLFPQTKVLSYLQNQRGVFRIMETDSRILPPNFSLMYKLQSIDGYDPLYVRRYAELLAASERGKSDITPPFGFNRIITPKKYDSPLIDLLGVKYVLSLDEISSLKFKKVFQEGKTYLYENKNVLPRVFFVTRTVQAESKQQAIDVMMGKFFNPRELAVVEPDNKKFNLSKGWSTGKVTVVKYAENEVILETDISTPDEQDEGFLVFMDTYYPSWHAVISRPDHAYEAESIIFRTNYAFRGLVVPHGKYTITFYNSLFPTLHL